MSTLLQLQQIHAASVLSRKASLSKKEREKRDYYIESNNIVEDKLGVSWSSRGIPRLVTGFEMRIPATVGMRGASPLEASYAFLSQYADLWKMSDPKRELSLIRKSVDRAGNTHLSFSQQYEGLPIFHSSFMVHLNPDLEVIGVNGLYVPVSDILLMPLVSKHRAEEIVRNSKLASKTRQVSSSELGLYNPEIFGTSNKPLTLAWRISTTAPGEARVYFVSAIDGELLYSYDSVEREIKMDIWFKDHQTGNCPSGERIYALGPYYFSGEFKGTSLWVAIRTSHVWSYFRGHHLRESYDGAGTIMTACSDSGVPGCVGAANLSGSTGPSFCDLGACQDIVGHEFTHKYVNHLANFVADGGQSQALDESFCDVFGEFVEKYRYGTMDWQLGGMGNSACKEEPDRSLSDPPSLGLPDPDHFSDYDVEFGHHSNAGIINKAAYLLGRKPEEGSETHHGVSVTGIGNHAEYIWYDVLSNWLTSSAQFVDFGNAVVNSAFSLYGYGENHTQSQRAVQAVGIWSPDFTFNLKASFPFSVISKFSMQGQKRNFMFFQGYGKSHKDLQYSYNKCSSLMNCTWSKPETLENAKGATALQYQDKIWIFFSSEPDNRIYYRTIDKTGALSAANPLPGSPSTDQALSATVFNKKIYLFYKAPGDKDQEIRYLRYDSEWATPNETEIRSDYGPSAVATLDKKLWLFVKSVSDDSVAYRSMDVNESWSPHYKVPNTQTVRTTPVTAVYRNKLHLITGWQPYYTSCDLPCTSVKDWSSNVAQDFSGQPSFSLHAGYDGWLYLFHGNGYVKVRKKFSE
jgi:Zn-dependent metalloprotease